MTDNPNQFEISMVHRTKGIDDSQSGIYKHYDKSGRTSAMMSNRASFSAVNKLSSQALRKDSPVRLFQQRFPEKYAQAPLINEELKPSQSVSSVIQNIFPEMQSPNAVRGGRVGALSARTQAYTQFMLEASFNAVSDMIIGSPIGGAGYTKLSPVDKAL